PPSYPSSSGVIFALPAPARNSAEKLYSSMPGHTVRTISAVTRPSAATTCICALSSCWHFLEIATRPASSARLNSQRKYGKEEICFSAAGEYHRFLGVTWRADLYAPLRQQGRTQDPDR